MLGLRRDGRDVVLASGSFFLGSGTYLDATGSPVEADAIHRGLVDSRVVNVSIDGDVYAANRLVVEEVPVVPAAAVVAMTKIAIPVTDSAVETDLCSPIAVMEQIPAVAPTPITRSPEVTDFGSHDPCPRNPKVIVVTVRP